MKKQNTIYTVLYRVNFIKPILQGIIVSLSSYPALLIEIFTRKKFGERYLPLLSCLTAILLLLIFFVFANDWIIYLNMLMGERGYADRPSEGFTVAEFIVLVYAGAALLKSFEHWLESKRQGATIDFKRYSRSHGIANKYVYMLTDYIPDWLYERLPVNEMNLRRYYEPLLAVFIGTIFMLAPFTRLLGVIVLVCGAFYYLRVRIQYSWGRDYLLDQIDKMIIADEMRDVFVEDKSPEESRGVMVMAPKPKSHDLKERFYQAMKKEFETPAAQEAEAIA